MVDVYHVRGMHATVRNGKFRGGKHQLGTPVQVLEERYIHPNPDNFDSGGQGRREKPFLCKAPAPLGPSYARPPRYAYSSLPQHALPWPRPPLSFYFQPTFVNECPEASVQHAESV